MGVTKRGFVPTSSHFCLKTICSWSLLVKWRRFKCRPTYDRHHKLSADGPKIPKGYFVRFSTINSTGKNTYAEKNQLYLKETKLVGVSGIVYFTYLLLPILITSFLLFSRQNILMIVLTTAAVAVTLISCFAIIFRNRHHSKGKYLSCKRIILFKVMLTFNAVLIC